MSRFSVAATLVAITFWVLNAGGAPTAARAASPTQVEPYWRCPAGYTFETSGAAVHCKRPAWTETKAFLPCMAPTPDLKIDLVNQTDMCSGAIGIAVTAEPICNPTDLADGFTKRRVNGKDFCGKAHPAEIVAPNQMVSF